MQLVRRRVYIDLIVLLCAVILLAIISYMYRIPDIARNGTLRLAKDKTRHLLHEPISEILASGGTREDVEEVLLEGVKEIPELVYYAVDLGPSGGGLLEYSREKSPNAHPLGAGSAGGSHPGSYRLEYVPSTLVERIGALRPALDVVYCLFLFAGFIAVVKLVVDFTNLKRLNVQKD